MHRRFSNLFLPACFGTDLVCRPVPSLSSFTRTNMKTSSVSPLPCDVKTMLQLLLALACVFLGGCATTNSVNFTPYVGQQRAWQTSPGALVITNYALPIYDGLPPRQYIVLGVCKAAFRHVERGRQIVVSEGQQRGADALVLLRSDLLNGGTVGGGQTYGYYDAWGHYYGSSHAVSRPVYYRVESYALIRWQTNVPASSAENSASTNSIIVPGS